MGEKQKNIMVVDDVPANLKLLQETLQASDYRVLTFPQGVMALKAAVKNPPDLILLDINMPEMNGFEVCERLKSHEELRTIPVLFISAIDESQDKVKAFSVGGVDYVTKPFQNEEVLARVRTHLYLKEMQAELEKHNLYLEELVQEKVRELFDSQMATILALSNLAESRDDDTGSHIERTRSYCKLLATKLKESNKVLSVIDDAFIENIYHAAPLHDIGKVGISDGILLKPDKLTPEEFEVMKTHTLIGAKTLRNVYEKYPQNTFLKMGIAIANFHHEKWDGSGYPEGLKGESIPLSARIMALADVYDALRSKRKYKPAFSHEKSCTIILESAGSHFAPEIVSVFRDVHFEFAKIYNQMDENNW